MLNSMRAGLSLLVLIVPSFASASSFTDIFVFGDSFSDRGNVFAATGGILPPDPPYDQGRFSYGPIWVEHLAQQLGLEIVANGSDPAVIKGNNFAVGAARAGVDVPVFPLGTIPSTLTQVQTFIDKTTQLPVQALYVVFTGHNDLLLAADPDEEFDAPRRQQIVREAVDSAGNAVSLLGQAGARHILLPNLADLGLTPRARFVKQNAPIASELTVSFNEALEAELVRREADADVTIHRLDAYRLANDVVEDARQNQGLVFGIVNVDMPIFEGFAGSSGADPLTSLFADDLHISAAAHRLLGDTAFAVVPEPASMSLILIGLAWLAASGVIRKRKGGSGPLPVPESLGGNQN